MSTESWIFDTTEEQRIAWRAGLRVIFDEYPDMGQPSYFSGNPAYWRRLALINSDSQYLCVYACNTAADPTGQANARICMLYLFVFGQEVFDQMPDAWDLL